MKLFTLTSAAGKRLIGKATAVHPAVQAALTSGTVAILCGTTNGYVAEEILSELGQGKGFDRQHFFRGITLPPYRTSAELRAIGGTGAPASDVIIANGVWQQGRTIFDVADELKEGDVVIKGANAVDLARRRAAILVANPKGGTILAALPAVIGRRVRLLLPVGLEKRVPGDLDALAGIMNAPGAQGPRLLPVAGEVLTELEAITALTGATAELVAAGGVGGAEGCIWLAVSGTAEQENAAQVLLKPVSLEPPFAP